MGVIWPKCDIANPSPLYLPVSYLFGTGERSYTLDWHHLDRYPLFWHSTKVFIHAPTSAPLTHVTRPENHLMRGKFWLPSIYHYITSIEFSIIHPGGEDQQSTFMLISQWQQITVKIHLRTYTSSQHSHSFRRLQVAVEIRFSTSACLHPGGLSPLFLSWAVRSLTKAGQGQKSCRLLIVYSGMCCTPLVYYCDPWMQSYSMDCRDLASRADPPMVIRVHG